MELASKMMAEALAKASAELEKTINELTEQLTAFNHDLEKSFQDELKSVRDRLELALHQNQDGLVRDKEAIIKTLAEFKQAEIEKVILAGKTVRSGLAAQVEDSTRSLSSTVSGKILEIKEKLSAPELELKKKFEEVQQALQSCSSDAHEQLTSLKSSQEEGLTIFSKETEAQLSSNLSEGQQILESRFGRSRKELDKESEKIVSELAQKYDDVIARLETSYHDGLVEVRRQGQDSIIKVTQIADSANAFVADQDKAFSDGLTDLGKLLSGLYETRLNNLAAQSRSEIVSAAQHAEETLAATRSELKACLKEFQRDYAAQFEALNTKLEKSLDEFSKKRDGGSGRTLRDDRARGQLQNMFKKIGQVMLDSAASAAHTMEADFQKSMDAFEQRIEKAKTQACESLERESKLMQKELTSSFQKFEKEISELKDQASELERKGKEAANIVMTLRQANLEF